MDQAAVDLDAGWRPAESARGEFTVGSSRGARGGFLVLRPCGPGAQHRLAGVGGGGLVDSEGVGVRRIQSNVSRDHCGAGLIAKKFLTPSTKRERAGRGGAES
eukprot:3706431-Prymnesium_polylepis.1